MRTLELDNLHPLFDALSSQRGTVLWVRNTEYDKQIYLSPSFESIWKIPVDTIYERPSTWNQFLVNDKAPTLQKIKERHSGLLDTSTLYFTIKNARGETLHIKDDCFKLVNRQQKLLGFAGLGKQMSYEAWMEDQQKRNNYQEITNIAEQLELHTAFKAAETISLTSREEQCLKLLVNGETAKTSAKILGVSPRTIEMHLANAKKKYDCSNQANLIKKYLSQKKTL